MIIDTMKMRNNYIVWNLKDWSLRDEQGNKEELEHNGEGALTRETIAKVYNVFPTLMDVFLTLFEKVAILTT